MRIDLTDLRLLLETIESGSITKGAERANMTLASASARIRNLEHALAAQLFERRSRGIVPTAAGLAVARHAREIQNRVHLLFSEVAEHSAAARRRVSILANSISASEYLPEEIGRFLLSSPGVDVDLEVAPSRDIAEAISVGRADLGVLAAGPWLEGLEHVGFRVDRIVLAVPGSSTAFEETDAVPLPEFAHLKFVGLQRTDPFQMLVSRQFARSGRPLSVRMRVADYPSLQRLVELGVGAAVVPLAIARRLATREAVRIVEIKEPWSCRRLVVAARSFADLRPDAAAIARWLTAAPDRAE